MEPLICPNCGGHINRQRMKCEYCGTEFRDEFGKLVRIETVPCRTRVLKCNTVVSRSDVDYGGSEYVQHYVKNEMARRVAEALVPMMDFEVSDDSTLNAVVVRGRIRIVEPEYRFREGGDIDERFKLGAGNGGQKLSQEDPGVG